MRQIFAAAAFVFGLCASAFAGSSFHTVARLQSAVIPADILAGGKVWCVFNGPAIGWTAPPLGNFCWAGNVLQAGVWTIKVYSWTTGEMAEGSALVPGPECTGTSPPTCVIAFNESDGD